MDYTSAMRAALALAREAAEAGETPVGAVILSPEGAIVGRGRNRTEERDATCHAEVEAIRDATRRRGNWRLTGCTLVVTMEPCPMCAGAILNARVSGLVFGARDRRLGSCGSVIHLFMENYGFSPAIRGGVLEEECAQILGDFFRARRGS